jgi:hypothetical protein
MSDPLLHSAADVICQALIDLGICADAGVQPYGDWPAFVDNEPDGDDIPDNVVTVYNTSGQAFPRTMVDLERIEYSGIQVRVRSENEVLGYRKAKQIAKALDKILDALVSIEGTDYHLHTIIRDSTILPLGKESETSSRNLHTVNGIVNFNFVPPAVPPQYLSTVALIPTVSAGPPLAVVSTPHALSATWTASRLIGIRIAFDLPITSVDPGAFTIVDRPSSVSAGGTTTLANPGEISWNPSGSTVNLTFTGATGVANFGSLPDGIWRLTINMSKVYSNGTPGSGTVVVDNIRRFFGDSTGDGIVIGDDFDSLGAAFNTALGDPTFDPIFDYDNDEVVSNNDSDEFGMRYGAGLDP